MYVHAFYSSKPWKPIEKLKKIRVFHGFRLQKMKLKGRIRLVPKEVTFKF